MDTSDILHNQDLTQNLFETVYTKDDLVLFYKQIDQLIALLFTGDGTLEQKMDSLISKDKKKGIMYYLTFLKTNTQDLVEVKEALSKIQRIGDNIPVVVLELAFEPTETSIKTISSWFIRRINAKVVLDLHYERRIVGGAYIAVNGQYKDYTLQTKIDNYFTKSS